MESKHKPNFFLIILGVTQLIFSTYFLLTINFNLGQLLLLFFALACTLWGIFFERIRLFTRSGFGKWIKYVFLGGVTFWIAIMCFITYFGLNDTADFKEDAVIVLGAGIRGDQVTRVLAYRLNQCIEYHLQNPSALIIVSGGQGLQETVTEAFAMKKYLIAHGIPEDKIISEEKATSTYENFLFSQTLLSELLDRQPYRITYITNQFHAYRAGLVAQSIGLDTTRFSASIDWYMIAPNYARETLAVLKTWVLGP